MKHYLFGIKITVLYLLGWIFRVKFLQEEYGYRLFHWVMPYAENKGYDVTLEYIKYKRKEK